jgi:hypothetical protein
MTAYIYDLWSRVLWHGMINTQGMKSTRRSHGMGEK